MLAFSSTEGMRIVRLGVVFDIVLDLSALRVAETDDAAHVTAIHESHEVQTIACRHKTQHANLVVLEPFVHPDEGFVPGELLGQRKGKPVTSVVELVFDRIELDALALM